MPVKDCGKMGCLICTLILCTLLRRDLALWNLHRLLLSCLPGKWSDHALERLFQVMKLKVSWWIYFTLPNDGAECKLMTIFTLPSDEAESMLMNIYLHFSALWFMKNNKLINIFTLPSHDVKSKLMNIFTLPSHEAESKLMNIFTPIYRASVLVGIGLQSRDNELLQSNSQLS